MEVEKKLTSIFYFKKYLEEIIMETYEEFINNILETRGRFACGEEYHERHHIKPKCMGGTETVRLTIREHIFAHELLVMIYGFEEHDKNSLIKMLTAIERMSN